MTYAKDVYTLVFVIFPLANLILMNYETKVTTKHISKFFNNLTG